jgi:hypothetical protein
MEIQDGWLFPAGALRKSHWGGVRLPGMTIKAGSLQPFPGWLGHSHLNTGQPGIGIQAGTSFFESRNAAQPRHMTKSRGAGLVGFFPASMDCFSLEAP